MNLKDESLYYIKRVFKNKDLQAKQSKAWVKQLYQHHCIFIHIPKTAGISVSVSLLGESIGNMPALYYRSLLGKKIFAEYFKFAFVRHPFTRLISSYEYLRNGGGGPLDVKNSEVVKPYDSLQDFVLNYLSPATAKANRYFRPQYQFVCDSDDRMLINFLGRFETLHADYDYIRQKINTGEPLMKLNVTPSYKHSLQNYFSNDKMIKKITTIYQKDFEMFGYQKDVSATGYFVS